MNRHYRELPKGIQSKLRHQKYCQLYRNDRRKN
nr:MAG TPA: hypothetical protein [Caudoviricetes sp.]